MLFLADESFFLFLASAGSGCSGAASGFSKRCVCVRFSLRHARMGFHQKGSCSKTAQIYLNYLDNALFHALFVKFITVVSRSFRLRVPAFRFCAVPRFAGFSLRAVHRSSSHKKQPPAYPAVVSYRCSKKVFLGSLFSASRFGPRFDSGSGFSLVDSGFVRCLRFFSATSASTPPKALFFGPFFRLRVLRFRSWPFWLFSSLSPVFPGPFLRFLSPVSAPFRPLFGPVS